MNRLITIFALSFASMAAAQTLTLSGGSGSGGSGATPEMPYLSTASGLSDSENYIVTPLPSCGTLSAIQTPTSNHPAPTCSSGTNGTIIYEATDRLNSFYQNNTTSYYMKTVSSGTKAELDFILQEVNPGSDPAVGGVAVCDATDKWMLVFSAEPIGSATAALGYYIQMNTLDNTLLCAGAYGATYFNNANTIPPVSIPSSSLVLGGTTSQDTHFRIRYQASPAQVIMESSPDGDQWHFVANVCASGCFFAQNVSPFAAEGVHFLDGNQGNVSQLPTDAYMVVMGEVFQ